MTAKREQDAGVTTPLPEDSPAMGRERGWRGSVDLWLQGAQELLAEGGVEAVKIGPLSARLGLSRTSFYWHFADREALLSALVAHWRAGNTAALLARARAPSSTITEAVLHVFDAWVDRTLFDSRAEFAVRTWALTDPQVSRALAEEDALRIAALTEMFLRFGYSGAEADTRARTIYLTQVGYIAMRAEEDFETRMTRIPAYALTFTGKAPTAQEVAAFRARHSGTGATTVTPAAAAAAEA